MSRANPLDCYFFVPPFAELMLPTCTCVPLANPGSSPSHVWASHVLVATTPCSDASHRSYELLSTLCMYRCGMAAKRTVPASVMLTATPSLRMSGGEL